MQIKDITQERCNGYEVLKYTTFHPIHYTQWKRFFSTEHVNETMELISKARGIHTWNKLSANEIIQSRSRVPHNIIAENYCPQIYNVCDIF